MRKFWNLSEADGIARLELDFPGSEVNILTLEGLNELSQIIDEVSARSDLKAILFTSAKKRIFIAGADIKEIEKIDSKSNAFDLAEEGKRLLKKIENLKIPTVSVINGACLGGGYELSLAATRRVAANSPNVKIGLPEVNLGILPGFGGSIRLPHLIGLKAALPLILAGKTVSASKAKKLGMVDRVFEENELIKKSTEYARELAEKKVTSAGKYRVSWVDRVLGPVIIYPMAKKDIMKRTKGFYPAPLKILKLVQKTFGRDMDEGFRKESEAFSELAVTEVSKNLIKIFFLNERYKKQQWTSADSSGNVEQCGLIGAGLMGGGIAQLVSSRGIPTAVKDISEKALQGALKEAQRIYEGGIKRGKITKSEMEKKMRLIRIGASNEELSKCDFVLEAVVEDMKIKKEVFKELGNGTKASTVLASNTSSLSVTEMADAANGPERVVGLHFFNPVHRMPLVEVIRGKKTSDETVEKTVRFARRLGKTVIVVKDSPGFLVNRLLMPYLNEAAYLMEEGFECKQIDRAAALFGMPMGPLELVDQIGIDVAYKVAHILQDAFGERMKVSGVLETVRKQGLLGKKSKAGFYIYEGKKKTPNPNIKITEKNKKISDTEDILKKLIYIMINEAAGCLEENVVDSAATVDIGMIMGTGFPPFRAGLLRYADEVGARNIVESLKKYQTDSNSARFEPCRYLLDLANSNKTFYSS